MKTYEDTFEDVGDTYRLVLTVDPGCSLLIEMNGESIFEGDPCDLQGQTPFMATSISEAIPDVSLDTAAREKIGYSMQELSRGPGTRRREVTGTS